MDIENNLRSLILFKGHDKEKKFKELEQAELNKLGIFEELEAGGEEIYDACSDIEIDDEEGEDENVLRNENVMEEILNPANMQEECVYIEKKHSKLFDRVKLCYILLEHEMMKKKFS